MNVMSDVSGVPVRRSVEKAAFQVDETHWGYIVKSVVEGNVPIRLRNAMSWFMGTTLLIATLGLWVMPGAMFDGDMFVIKSGLTTIFMSFACLCFWLTTRDSKPEFQFDLARREVRGVMRARGGSATLLESVSFDDVGSVDIRADLADADGLVLVLHIDGSRHQMEIAQGSALALEALQSRIEGDLQNPAIAAPRKSLQALSKGSKLGAGRERVAA